MATRALIGLQLADGSVLSGSHHWDGFIPKLMGVKLNEKFNTKKKVAELIDGGDMSACDGDNEGNVLSITLSVVKILLPF